MKTAPAFALVFVLGCSGSTEPAPRPPSSKVLNVDFGEAPTTKHGPAAFGDDDDVWNAVGEGFAMDFVASHLVWADGSEADASIHTQNLPGIWGGQTTMGDPMYESYIYSWAGESATTTVLGLPPGSYDVAIYGTTGRVDTNNSGFFVTVHDDEAGPARSKTATTFTSTGPDADAPDWVENGQYVLHEGIAVGEGQALRVNIVNGVQGAGNGGCLTNGMQLIKR